MRMRQIEIDDDVHSFLVARAEELKRQRDTPFVDATANGILRRALLSKRSPVASSATAETTVAIPETPQYPRGVPLALQQILEVVHLVRTGRHSRSEASHAVANERDVAPATVLDKYTRQIGLTAAEFDHLLAEDGLPELRNLLQGKFKEHEATISSHLNCKPSSQPKT